MRTGNLQRTDQTEPIVSTTDSGEASLSIAESSEQTFAPTAVSPPNVGKNLVKAARKTGADGLAIINVSKLTTAKIVDKRSSPV
jgi:hypothetical protein